MEKQRNITGLDHALELRAKGLRLVPLHGKQPLVKHWPELQLGAADICAWARRGVNWGIITHEPLIVVDTDTEEVERQVQAIGIVSPVMVRTGGGGLHRYFRVPEGMTIIRSKNGVHGIHGFDVKGYRSFIVAAHSVHPETGQPYEYLPGMALQAIHELPLFDPQWIRGDHHKPERTLSGDRGYMAEADIQNVQAYIRAIPSIQGQRGSDACYRVAALLFEAGYTDIDALAELEQWNQTNAVPLWSRAELVKKVRDVWRKKLGSSLDS